MELLQLHYFQKVARLQHMTKAAQELHIAQPALSQSIARLEENLGVPLFHRQGRQIRLNSYGQAFLAKVDIALHALEEGRREINDMNGTERGHLHIATTTLARFSEMIRAFMEDHPEINLRISQVSAEEAIPLIEAGEIDFCYTTPPIDKSGIGSVPLLREEIYIAVPPHHRLAGLPLINLSEIADEPFIGMKEGTRLRGMMDQFFSSRGMKPNIVCEVDEPAALRSFVGAGLGIALLSACKKEEASPLVLLPINDPNCRRTIQLAWLEKRYLSQAAHSFREYVTHYFAKDAKS
ncbi:LysR family transcriptional regulator [Paenibacillus sp. BC26]|uniref:LysR family transcriptional regulator n=1 Tax=Paenibacillus sp. BC26 TaxID=1881032 RepID=UPI0008E8CC77|nr:LysR family transcriptional regulator [Paenibacillus sp. BC26]SFT15115.1 DNA-binding transcriptional regulator, LysR family [Paenibacillus sp. BC26]